MHGRLGCAALLVAAFVIVAPRSATAADPSGTWLTQAGDARIRIARCGGNVCGTIVWLKDPIDPMTGKPQVDDKNPNPKLQNRRIIGLRIFSMAPEPSGSWSGLLYNADDGQSYKASVAATGPTQLEVRGCAGPFCGSETWSRVRGR
jgi:uncharacterized protein (DUF2147 family)